MAGLDAWYPPTWAGRPPSMPWGDWTVWQAFMATNAAMFEQYAYDVEIPADAQTVVSDDPAIQRMWERNTARRIDAIGRRGDVYTLIEVRSNASWQTLGQIIGYRTLFSARHPDYQLSPVMIVTDRMADDVQAVARAQGITVEIV